VVIIRFTSNTARETTFCFFVSSVSLVRKVWRQRSAFDIPIASCDLSLCSVCGTLLPIAHKCFSCQAPVYPSSWLQKDRTFHVKLSGNLYTSQWTFTWSFHQATQISTLRLVSVSVFMTTENRTEWTCIATFRFLIIQFTVVKGNFQLIFISRPWDGSLIVNAGFRLMFMQISVICSLTPPQSTFRQ
jgi:hypothetical protein